MRLVFLGLPGAGKGTQARLLGEALGLPQISTGDILRQALARGEELGRRVREYVESGRLVPDDLVLGIMEERLGHADCQQGFLLDGFPRTVDQARGLDALLERLGVALDRVILVSLEPEVLARRLGQRRVCPSCGAVYHLETRPPAREGICDECGDHLVARSDDEPEKILRRIDVYRQETEPLVKYFESRGLLTRVSGDGDINEVQASIRKALQLGDHR